MKLPPEIYYEILDTLAKSGELRTLFNLVKALGISRDPWLKYLSIELDLFTKNNNIGRHIQFIHEKELRYNAIVKFWVVNCYSIYL